MKTPKVDLKNLDSKKLLLRYWYVFVLLAIVLVGFYLRAMPARFGELGGLDEFYIYRMSEAVVNNDVQALTNDTTRYYPNSVNFWDTEFVINAYMPAYTYIFLTNLGLRASYLDFAIMWPAYMAAIAVFASYFVGKILFKSRYAGLLIAFFMATSPSFLTRTFASGFEKEAICAPFMVLSVYFFVKAFKDNSWKHGILSGLMLAFMGLSWGGVIYFYMLYGGFILFLCVMNFAVVALDYVFGGFSHILKNMEPFFSMKMVKAVLPTIAVSLGIVSLFPRNVLGVTGVELSYAAIAILAIKIGVERFKLVKKDQLPYVIPSVLVVGVLALLVGSMFSSALYDDISNVSNMIVFFFSGDRASSGTITSTVAENMPGDWDSVFSMLGVTYANNIPGFSLFSQNFALWIFMFLGMGLLAYRFYRTHDWMMILPLFWGITTIMGIFYRIRLAFLLGPPAAVLGGFFCAWALEKAFSMVKKNHLQLVTKHSAALFLSVLAGFAMLIFYRNTFGFASFVMLSIVAVAGVAFYTKRMKTDAKSLLPFAAVAFIGFVVGTNFASAYVYSSSITPVICFPQGDRKCLTIAEDGTVVLDPEQPWYQAMNYLSQQTPEDSVVLSWWDFGYWFQSRGQRNSIVDGGHIGGAGVTGDGRDYEVAEWFTSPIEAWGEHYWIQNYSVDYILMDYTLPGKYGAISKIASRGQQVIGFLEFQQGGMYPKDNMTVYTFTAGPYELWVPLTEEGSIQGGSPPMLLVKQGDQYVSKAYINDICTTGGIVRVAQMDQAIEGCVTLGNTGIFFIPKEAENTIFTSLQFMDGYGLPVEKVFDNQLIRIYKLTGRINTGPANSTA